MPRVVFRCVERQHFIRFFFLDRGILDHLIKLPEDRLNVVGCSGRHVHCLITTFLQFSFDLRPAFGSFRNIHLVVDHQLLFFTQFIIKQRHFLIDLVEVSDGILCLTVEHMQDHPGTLNVTQEGISQSHTHMSTFDQPRYIREDDRVIRIQFGNAKIRLQRRKGIVGDLRGGISCCRQERRLPRVRYTDDTHIRDQLQLQRQVLFLIGFTFFRSARCLIGRGNKMCVTASAPSALADDELLSVMGQISQHGTGFLFADDSARRNQNIEILSRFPRHIVDPALLTVSSNITCLVAKRCQRIQPAVYFQDQIAAMSAVTTVRAAPGNIFFTVKMHESIPALAGTNINFSFIYKHNFLPYTFYLLSSSFIPILSGSLRRMVLG